jgi:hypothetical protein
MKRNGCAGNFLPTDLFEVLSWATDNEYDCVTFSNTGPVIEQFAVYREPGAYGDTLMGQKAPEHLEYTRSQRDAALNALSVDGRTFEVTPDNIASALTAALVSHGTRGGRLVGNPIADSATDSRRRNHLSDERDYKTGRWDESIGAADELQRLLSFELERSKTLPLDPQQRLVHSLAEQIRSLLHEPL